MKHYRWHDIWIVPLMAYIRDLDLDSSFKARYLYRLCQEFRVYLRDIKGR